MLLDIFPVFFLLRIFPGYLSWICLEYFSWIFFPGYFFKFAAQVSSSFLCWLTNSDRFVNALLMVCLNSLSSEVISIVFFCGFEDACKPVIIKSV